MVPKRIFFIVLLFCAVTVQAQDQTTFKSAGAMMGLGKNLDRITYTPLFFAGDFSWQFKKGVKKTFFGWYLEPQFNLVFTDGPVQIELGSNIGIRFYQQLGEKFYLYQLLGSGPHLITANLARQAKGFIFSDNIGIGFFQLIKEKVALNFQVKYRHISNASLEKPNAGVNNIIVMVGLSKVGRK